MQLRAVEQPGEATDTGVHRIAHRMHDPRVGHQRMNQPKVDKVRGHLIGHTGAVIAAARQPIDIALRLGPERIRRQPGHHMRIARFGVAIVERQQPLQIMQFARAMHIGMTGKDRFGQGRARPRHSQHENRPVRGDRPLPQPGDHVGVHHLDDVVDLVLELLRVMLDRRAL
ncbi:hypothetical protein CBW24_17875 (plasmid) [Pacificitalea manganoxidans]|uniref:Uncharacterized protein n=1 Tax=Pacificitalea manganoxidans TaxID=1411902 RepID=A0A291M5B2_9RHOB|nr:hypothetical protein CBW24_17875 [Pacificitalea manganoxidans]